MGTFCQLSHGKSGQVYPCAHGQCCQQPKFLPCHWSRFMDWTASDSEMFLLCFCQQRLPLKFSYEMQASLLRSSSTTELVCCGYLNKYKTAGDSVALSKLMQGVKLKSSKPFHGVLLQCSRSQTRPSAIAGAKLEFCPQPCQLTLRSDQREKH